MHRSCQWFDYRHGTYTEGLQRPLDCIRNGDADKETVDKHNKVEVPPEAPKYTLRRLWLTKEEENHYYYGFSNEGLWPLCHIAHTRPTFRNDDWQYYKKVNEEFAKAVLDETKNEEQPFILIQDFHFALLPELIKSEKPKAKVCNILAYTMAKSGIFWNLSMAAGNTEGYAWS